MVLAKHTGIEPVISGVTGQRLNHSTNAPCRKPVKTFEFKFCCGCPWQDRTAAPAVSRRTSTAELRDNAWLWRPRPPSVWCPGRDLNPHALRRHPLKMVCLPISPPGHADQAISTMS